MSPPFSLNAIAEKLSSAGLQQRQEQLDMISAVYQTVSDGKILVVEAPTGTGKTLAYCLGALSASQSAKTLIISTATTALQEQFFQKDLPILEKVLEKKFSVVLAKGRRRYVCHSRLFNFDESEVAGEITFQLNELRELLNSKKWNGESDQLTVKLNPSLWQEMSTDSSGCIASRCEYFNECVFFQNRRNMHQADMVVVNHSLLLADLELGGGVVLPEMKNSIYILDECHHLPEKALMHFAKQAAVIRSLEWINHIGKLLTKSVLHIKIKDNMTTNLSEYVKTLVEALHSVKEYFDQRNPLFMEDQLRLKEVDEALKEIANSVVFSSRKILSMLEPMDVLLEAAYEKNINEDNKAQAEVINQLQSNLRFILERTENLMATWQGILSNNQVEGEPPIACWFEKKRVKHQYESEEAIDYTCHTSPINVSAAMQDLFWNKIDNAVILCSATVRAVGKFDDFLRKLGLKNNEDVEVKALMSPFEYQHSLLYIPAMKAEPTMQQQDQHLLEIVALLPKLVLPRSGTLVLFTSRRAMEHVFQHMPGEMKKDILLQDEQGKMELIKRHKMRIDRQFRSIIFGLASLAEGIDLPGRYCQHVIIQKIPFAVPSDPIAKTRAEWLQQHNADPFHLVSLPEASIKLAQFIGRLLRHEDDRGIVTVLDKRLYSKGYGMSLLQNLPPFTQLVNQTLENFLSHQLAQSFY